ncbi:hypothetical protein SMACR_09472 [Sordaria macrospora]|uniref:WGS project CABT00000000 data, contig 2.62 n=2 Tax=Sordaria macrospora TaxID=5147 RepID=F7WAL1_SORMK|nr:uncharacterized protein SMAC_09472 [Sordaria macrospora k-hell]KAA8623934.1 hypothetical protein SMACR_09472 [Sordaria macrospora]WPJ62617.1 hypothetical protein SMAC4_09472 [Sordaria macrospora]CCC14206.1 unnamed protein product [Sordaria macrospora k-hell]
MHSTDTYDVRRGKRIPKLLTAYFPNYMDRFEALLALMRHSKAAVADLIAESYMDRTKLSSNHTNKLRNFNKDVKAAARFSGRTITENGITRIYDVAGNLVKQFCRPEKRPLSELLGNRLAAIAKPKRDKTRTTSGPTSGNSSNSESPVGAAGGFLTPIQEEDENVVAASQGQEEGHLDEASEKNENAGEAFHHPKAYQHSPCNEQAYGSHQYPTPDETQLLDEQSNLNISHNTTSQHLPLGKSPTIRHPTADQNLLPGGQSVFSNQFPTTEQDLLVSGLSHSNNQYTPDQSPRFNQQAYGSDNYFTPDCHQHALVGEQLVQH